MAIATLAIATVSLDGTISLCNLANRAKMFVWQQMLNSHLNNRWNLAFLYSDYANKCFHIITIMLKYQCFYRVFTANATHFLLAIFTVVDVFFKWRDLDFALYFCWHFFLMSFILSVPDSWMFLFICIVKCLYNGIRIWLQKPYHHKIYFCFAPGDHSVYLKLDIFLVRGLSKHTLSTYFPSMKIDPNYALFACFFL